MHRLVKSPVQFTCRTIRDSIRLRQGQFGQRCSLCHTALSSTIIYDHHRVYRDRFLVNLTKNRHESYPPPVLSSAASYRYFHSSLVQFNAEPLKPSSKVEETVTVLKEKQEKEKQQLQKSTATSPAVVGTKAPVTVEKKSLKKKIIDELVHYYHGFRLLFIDINVSRRLLWRVLNGNQLTRREHKLLVRTVGDLFRLVPFSVFIIVPFMEFLLPVFIKFFPNMLPSTFQTSSEQEDKNKKSLKVQIEMAKFLQRTIDEMPVTSKGHSSESAKEFAEFFAKLRTSGEMTTSEEIMKFSKLFEDEITLDSLPRPQLMALCRVLDMNPIGTTNFLRFQLRLKLRSLAADDLMIQKEGIDSLSQSELQAACRARGMRALGVSVERLKAQLSQWLDLSLVKKVPPSLLLLSQAFMLPDSTPTEEKLAATIQALPDVVGTATKAVIGEREGKVDYKTKIDIIKEEVAMIKEERKEQQEEESKILAQQEKKKEEILVDTAPILMDKSSAQDPVLRSVIDDIKKTAISERLASEDITNKDMEALESALETLGKDKKRLLVEKEELQDLREEMAEYQEDIADLQKVLSASGKEADVKETVAAQRLFRKVNKMISKIESALNQLEPKEEGHKKAEDLQKSSEPILVATAGPPLKKPGEDSLRIDDLINTMRKIQGVPESSLEKLNEILLKMDADKDGAIRIDNILKMLELVGSENVKLSKRQVNELIDLIDKEEAIEMDELILRALKKSELEQEEKAAAAASPTDPTSVKGFEACNVPPPNIPVATTVSTTSPSAQPPCDKSKPPSSASTAGTPPKSNKPMDTMTTNIAASMKNPTVNPTVTEPKSSSSHGKLAK